MVAKRSRDKGIPQAGSRFKAVTTKDPRSSRSLDTGGATTQVTVALRGRSVTGVSASCLASDAGTCAYSYSALVCLGRAISGEGHLARWWSDLPVDAHQLAAVRHLQPIRRCRSNSHPVPGNPSHCRGTSRAVPRAANPCLCPAEAQL